MALPSQPREPSEELARGADEQSRATLQLLYGGARFPMEARLAGRTFAKFHLDVSRGDVLRKPYEMRSGRNLLWFVGIASTKVPAVSPEEQFAEKIHACTLPRVGRENTRVKDLVDLVLLIERTKLDVARLPKAIRETFQRRKTHDIHPYFRRRRLRGQGHFQKWRRNAALNPTWRNILVSSCDSSVD